MNKQPVRLLLILSLGATLVLCAFGVRRYERRRLQRAKDNATHAKLAEEESRIYKLRAAVLAAPNDPAPLKALIQCDNEYNLTADAAKAEAALIRISPKDVDARVQLGAAELTSKQYIQAEANYRAALKVDPKTLAAWQGLATSLFFQKRYLEGIGAADTAMKLKRDDVNSDLILASCALYYAIEFPNPLVHAGELRFARTELLGLTKVFPKNAEIIYMIGVASVAMRDRDMGVEYLRRAITMRPDSQEGWRMLISAYKSSGETAEALKLARDAHQHFPTSPLFDDLLGQLLHASGEKTADQESVELFRTAARSDPNNPDYLEHLGTAMMQTNDNKDAAAAFGRAARFDSYNPFVFQELAALYTRLGEPDKSRKVADVARQLAADGAQQQRLEEIERHHPEAEPIHYILAERYRQIGQLHLALEEYVAVLRINPNNKLAKERIEQMARASGAATPAP